MISSTQRLHRYIGAVCGGVECGIVTASISTGSFTERQVGHDIAIDLAIG